MPFLDQNHVVIAVFVGSLIIASIFIVVRAVTFFRSAKRWDKKPFNLGDPMGKPSWDFTKSWATTLTAATAILTAVLATKFTGPAALPAQTVAANLLAALIVATAPFAFNAACRIVEIRPAMDATPGTPPSGYQLQGNIGWYMVAAFLTYWGVVMQLANVWFYVPQLAALDPNPPDPNKPPYVPPLTPQVMVLFEFLLLVLFFLVMLYTWKSIEATIRDTSLAQKPRIQADALGVGQATAEQPPSWSLL